MVPRVARSLLWATALLPALIPPGALANGHHGAYAETVYYQPTSLVVPTTYSYAVPTSYVVPTTYSYSSYYTPTVYTSTSYSYLAPTTYLSTTDYLVPTTYTYRRRAGRYAATSYSYYVPTTYSYSYYTPTVYEYPVVATAAAVPLCDESAVPFAPPAGSRGGSGGKGAIDSTSTNGKKEPGLNSEAARARGQEAGGGGANPADESASPPPAAGAKEGGDRGGVENPQDEVLPPPSEALPGANEPQAMLRRQARKPVADANSLQLRPRRQQQRALLSGRVLSGASGQAEPGVKVVFANRGGRFEDRDFTSDAKGHFDVAYLPDGDWSVQVEDAAGKAVTYATLTVSGGRVTDETGREWTALTLNR